MKLGTYIMPPEANSTAYFINPSHQQYQHCAASQIVEVITLILLERLKPILMKLGICIIPSEAISTAYFINLSHQ
jgi:hypothetical protein